MASKSITLVSPREVHFVGSVCLPDTRAVFIQLSKSLRSRLRRIPDGETGERHNFVLWQRRIFHDFPFLLRNVDFSPQDSKDTPVVSASDIKLRPLEYDDFAIASYEIFCKLREEGIVPKGVRFQISLPSPLNVLHINIDPAYQAIVEPLYLEALLSCLRRIQDAIPVEDLAIQWDLAAEFAILEGVATSPPKWLTPSLKKGILDRIESIASAVDSQVDLGFHFCYGDFQHKHFVEPRDMGLLVEVANEVLRRVKKERAVTWIHMPVPKNRVDINYFAPLKNLDVGKTKIYLGILQKDDLEGTKKKIAVASEFLSEFGVATECGLGRADEVELESILEIARQVTTGN